MAIQFQEKGRIFSLHTDNTTYQMQADSYGNLLHLYYGDRVDGSMEYLLTYGDRGFSPNPYEAGPDRTYSLDALPQEYPYQGGGDFRSPALAAEQADGSFGCGLRYERFEICGGKYGLSGLPAMYRGDMEDVETLKVYLKDPDGGLAVTLLYGVFPGYDIITRAVEIRNSGGGTVALKRVYSACLDFLWGEYDLIQFYGRHAMERNLQRTPVAHGSLVIGSRRGTSSHQYNPFVILAGHGATEDYGSCYGMSFVYSGAFKAEAEKDQYGQTRLVMGLQDEMFSYELAAGETFTGPEVIMSYSARGLGALSRKFHRGIRYNLCRGRYKTSPRPVIINNWEATYFDFTGEKIFDIAKQAGELGVEMMVLDDGWFGKRDSDFSGLGDWRVNEVKLGGTLKCLVTRVNGLGMKFGLWVEPEMVSEDSDLYRSHPDWAFAIPGRKPVRGRSQLVLDFSRKEVVDYIYDSICKVLDSANIEYLKWDMNRSIADVYSAVSGGLGIGNRTDAGRGGAGAAARVDAGAGAGDGAGDAGSAGSANPGTVLYRYVLGLYDFLERLISRYPGLLIEGCSGGGGRFDAGMLYYTPQIWCSDNTDAVDRIRIQYGTSFGYPVSAVGSHVSAVPNHQTGRVTPLETRGVAAMAGSFGYELNLNAVTEEEKECVRRQIRDYHRYWELIHNGDYYRLTNPFRHREAAAWLFVREDRGEALLNAVTLEVHGNQETIYIRLAGLDPEAMYRDRAAGRDYPGAGLMSAGIPLPPMTGEYRAWQAHLIRID